MKVQEFFRNNDYLPVFGGGSGALFGNNLLHLIPSTDKIVGTIILTLVGGVVGYLVKLAMDAICKKR